jgi:protein-tyrosine phosphatase
MTLLRFDTLGGRRSAAQFFGYRAFAAVGGFGRTRAIEAGRVQRLVFICSGNICRSPYADWKIRGAGLEVASCGTSTVDGSPANESARRIARERGIDLAQHASLRVESLAFQAGDLAVALEPRHLEVVEPLTLRAGAQATLLGMWCEPRLPFIPDPFARSDACFRHVFDLIDDGLKRLLDTLGTGGRREK